MDDTRNFDILDQFAIRCICDSISLHDLINLKQCSKRLNRIVSKYLSDTTYKIAYLNRQSTLVSAEIDSLYKRIEHLQLTKYQITRYKELHSDSIKPDGYMSTAPGVVYSPSQAWLYCSVEYAIKHFKNHLGLYHIYVKSGQPQKRYDCIQEKMDKLGFQRVFIPNKPLKYQDVYMMFTKKGCELYKPFHNCKVCGKDHALQECDTVVCNICKTKGHLTQRCPLTVCKICKKIGSHLTSRCPNIRCNRCRCKGHIEKRCRKKPVPHAKAKAKARK